MDYIDLRYYRVKSRVKILELSYRQKKRLWKRYRGEGAKGLQHCSAGRGSNCAKPEVEYEHQRSEIWEWHNDLEKNQRLGKIRDLMKTIVSK